MDLAKRVQDGSSPEPNTGCFLWFKAHDQKGYGFIWKGTRMHRAHRVAWELANGPIADGLTVDHLCRVRECVNPDHMEIVTSAENVLRSSGPGALNAKKTTCKHGHELTGTNLGTYTHKNGKLAGRTRRHCKTCAAGH